jgi:hypothetical protein
MMYPKRRCATGISQYGGVVMLVNVFTVCWRTSSVY